MFPKLSGNYELVDAKSMTFTTQFLKLVLITNGYYFNSLIS